MSYNSIFDSSSEVDVTVPFSDTASSSSLETVIFNPTIDIRTFHRNGSWPAFPPPHTPSSEAIIQNHNPVKEAEDLPPLGSEPRDPTLRIPTSDLIDIVTFSEDTPPAYTSNPIRGIEAYSLRRNSPEEDYSQRISLDSSTLRGAENELLDSPGIISIGQRMAQEERAHRSRRVHFGGTTEYRVPPLMAWLEDSISTISTTSITSTSNSVPDLEEGNIADSSYLLSGEADENPWRRTEVQRVMRYNPEPSFVKRTEIEWRRMWREGNEGCAVCFGECVVM